MLSHQAGLSYGSPYMSSIVGRVGLDSHQNPDSDAFLPFPAAVIDGAECTRAQGCLGMVSLMGE